MSKHTTIEVWADEDVVSGIDLTSSGQKRINLLLVDFFDTGKSVMVHMGPKQALETIRELQQALVDLAVTPPSHRDEA